MSITTLGVYTADADGVALVTGTSTGDNIQTITTDGTVIITTDDFSHLSVRAVNTSSTKSIILTVESDEEYSQGPAGDQTVTITTEGTVVFGPLESARYKTSSGTLVITIPSTGLTGITIDAGILNL